jgi:arylsulfatase A
MNTNLYKRGLACALVCPFLVASPAAAGSLPARPPNFIVILVDDLGYADIGPFGSTLHRTPNLDRLAQEGRKLTRFYAAPVCSPSRAALLTGCQPKRVLPIPQVLWPGAAVGLNPAENTIAELLQQNGYSTACIGKWHLGDQPEFLPTRQGFDYYFGIPYSNDMGPAEDGCNSSLGEPVRPRAEIKYLPGEGPEIGIKGNPQPPLPLLENEKVIEILRADGQTTLVKRYTEKAIEFIKAHKNKCFFLFLAHTAVHFPFYPGEHFQGKSRNGAYGDWVEEVDWSVGQIVNELRQLNLDDNTFLIFTSDNGGGAGVANNAPLRGFKNNVWEGGVRVPTIVWWPGQVPSGTATPEMAGMQDILPTLLNLSGGRLPADRKIDGHDIWPLLSGKPGAKSPHDVFYFYHGLKLEAISAGCWKLHLASGELYNLDSDIGESENVAAAQPKVVKRLQTLAARTKDDLAPDGIGPGCRPLGRVANPSSLVSRILSDELGKPNKRDIMLNRLLKRVFFGLEIMQNTQ